MPNRRLADRDELVLRLRSEGETFQAIADAMGVSSNTSAWKYYRRAVARRDGVPVAAVPYLRNRFVPREPYVTPTAAAMDPGLEGPNFAAWAAGFFDGEGCVHASIEQGTRGQKDQLQVIVSQVTPEPLLALQRRWGGSIRDHRAPKATWQHQWHWRIHGRAAEPFLRDIQPFLRVKHEHVALALEYIDLIWSRGYEVPAEVRAQRTPLLRAIRALNARRHTRERRAEPSPL